MIDLMVVVVVEAIETGGIILICTALYSSAVVEVGDGNVIHTIWSLCLCFDDLLL